MTGIMKKTLILLLLLIHASYHAGAQRQPSVISPEIHPDKTTTFRLHAPSALKVTLDSDMTTLPVDMTRDSSGIWSVTLGRIRADLYAYSFIVDGVRVCDPNNTLIESGTGFKNSLVEIPGDSPPMISLIRVPHGNIHYRYYHSSKDGEIRPLVIYTPPGFNICNNIRYPVIYLLHDETGNEESWVKTGRVNLIADNLIAMKRTIPVIIVMPYTDYLSGTGKDLTDELIDDIIPFVEEEYPVVTESADRAIAGFGKGGALSAVAGLSNPGIFANICTYAPETENKMYDEFISGWNPDPEELKEQIKHFSVHIGSKDYLYEKVLGTVSLLLGKGLILETHYAKGAHDWISARTYLTNSLQELF